MFIVVFFIVIKKCKNQMSDDERINQMWCIHPMEYYLAIEMNEVQIGTTWMNLKSIMLSERSQTQMVIYCMTIYMKCLE